MPHLCPSTHRCIQDPDIIVTVSQIMSLQYTPTEVSEDCLYLNIYAPAEATPGDKLPVCWTLAPAATVALRPPASPTQQDGVFWSVVVPA